MGAAKTLRVAILGIKVPEARRYHVSVQVLAKGQAPAGVVALDGATFDLRPDQVARTETTPLEANPMFLNRVFVMRLPESLEICPSINLHCNLFATPALGTSNAGAIVAGKEVDELVGAATLQIRGDVAARLLRGERCTLPAVLGSGAAEDNGGTPDAITLASMFGSRATREVLLELMLLDANLTLPRDAPLVTGPAMSTLSLSLPAATSPGAMAVMAPPGMGGGPDATTARARPGEAQTAAPAQCKLQVLVVRAENLPTVRNADGAEVPPDTFVSAASMADVRNRVTPKSVTSTFCASQNPTWGQMLEVTYAEQDLADEHVCLGIVNDNNSRLMLKASIPLASLVPRLHYNLRLTMPGGLLGSSVSLFVTLCLVECPGLEHRRLLDLVPSFDHCVEARLVGCNQQLEALVEASNPPSSGAQYQEVVGVWRVQQNAQHSGGRAEAAISNPGGAQNGKADKEAGKAVAGNADGGMESKEGPLDNPQPGRTDSGKEGKEGSSVEAGSTRDGEKGDEGEGTPGAAGRPQGGQEGSVAHKAEAGGSKGGEGSRVSSRAGLRPIEPVRASDVYTHIDASNPAEAVKAMQALSDKLTAPRQQFGTTDMLPLRLLGSFGAGLDGGLLWGPDHLVSLLTQRPTNASLCLELHALGSRQPVTLPLARILLPLPSVGCALPNTDRLSTTHSNIPLQLCNIPGATCNMELCVWQLAAYKEHVRKALPAGDLAAGLSSSLHDPKAMLSQMSWQDIGVSQKLLGSSYDITLGQSQDGGSAALLEALVDDLWMKQIAIERITRQQDTTEARTEIMSWRLADAEQRSKVLTQENQRLRQLLHEDKEAQKNPLLLKISPNLSREQLVERTETALAAYSRERRRNTELVHRLQQMHSEQVDVLEMKKRYQELQAAHMELGRAMSDPNNSVNKLAKYRMTVKTQEEVISNLERLLTQAMSRAKALPALEAKHRAAVAELEGLRRGPLIELEALRKGPLQELEWLRKEKQSVAGVPQGMALSEVHELRKAHAREVHDLKVRQVALEEQVAEAAEKMELLEQERERFKGKAEASREELITTIKRYAEEISALKWRLAEKDAQLMGGFGANSIATPPWMAHTRASPLGTPDGHHGHHQPPFSLSMSTGLPIVQVPAYSPTTSSHASLQPTPTRTSKPLSPPIPPLQPTSSHPSRRASQNGSPSHSQQHPQAALPKSPGHQAGVSQLQPIPGQPEHAAQTHAGGDGGVGGEQPFPVQLSDGSMTQQQLQAMRSSNPSMTQQQLQAMRSSNPSMTQQQLQAMRSSNSTFAQQPQQQWQQPPQQWQQQPSQRHPQQQVPLQQQWQQQPPLQPPQQQQWQQQQQQQQQPPLPPKQQQQWQHAQQQQHPQQVPPQQWQQMQQRQAQQQQQQQQQPAPSKQQQHHQRSSSANVPQLPPGSPVSAERSSASESTGSSYTESSSAPVTRLPSLQKPGLTNGGPPGGPPSGVQGGAGRGGPPAGMLPGGGRGGPPAGMLPGGGRGGPPAGMLPGGGRGGPPAGMLPGGGRGGPPAGMLPGGGRGGPPAGMLPGGGRGGVPTGIGQIGGPRLNQPPPVQGMPPPPMGQMLQAAWPRRDSPGSRAV